MEYKGFVLRICYSRDIDLDDDSCSECRPDSPCILEGYAKKYGAIAVYDEADFEGDECVKYKKRFRFKNGDSTDFILAATRAKSYIDSHSYELVKNPDVKYMGFIADSIKDMLDIIHEQDRNKRFEEATDSALRAFENRVKEKYKINAVASFDVGYDKYRFVLGDVVLFLPVKDTFK